MPRFWAYEAGETIGPLTVEEIIDRDGWMDDYYCRVGDEDWKRPEDYELLAEKLEELKPSTPPPAEQGPPNVPDDIQQELDSETEPSDQSTESPSESTPDSEPSETTRDPHVTDSDNDSQTQRDSSGSASGQESAVSSVKNDTAEVQNPFVARQQERRQLREILEGERQEVCAVVTGDGGMGKSRLVSEVLDRHESDGSEQTMVQGDHYSDHNPYASLLPLFDQALGIDADDRPAGLREIKNRFGDLGSVAEDIAVVYGAARGQELSTFGQEDSGSVDQQYRERSSRLANFLYESFQDELQVVYLDDVQWIEPSSIRLIEQILERQRHEDPRIYVLMTSRMAGVSQEVDRQSQDRLLGEELEQEDSQPPLESILELKDSVLRLDLDPMNQQEIERLVAESFPGVELHPDLIDELHEKTNGVALHLEQALWFLVDRELIQQTNDGTWELTEFDGSFMPPSIDQLVEQRVEVLDELPRKTLQSASILGASFERWLIADVLEQYSEEQVDSALYDLLTKRFLRAQEGRYIFQHTTIQDVTYELIPPDYKQKIHSRAAELISQNQNDDDPFVEDRLVRHYRGAEEWDKVVKLRIDRIEQALKSHESREAKGFIEEIEQAGWPDGLEDYYRARYLRSRGILAYQEYETDSATDDISQALDQFRELNKPNDVARCLYWLGRCDHSVGDLSEAEEHVRESLEIYENEHNDRGRALCYRELGSLANRQGRIEMANRYFERALEIDEMLGDTLQQGRDLFHIGKMKEVKQGDLEQARDYYERSLQKLSDLRSQRLQASTYASLGRVCRKQDDLERAENLLNQALELYEEIGEMDSCAFTYRAMAQLALQRDNPEEGYELYTKSYEMEENCSNLTGKCYAAAGMADCARELGNLKEAYKHVETAVELSEKIGDTKNLAFCYSLKGRIARQEGSHADAMKWLTKSLELNREIGRDKTRAYVLTLQGEIKREMGDLDQARDYFERSAEINDMLDSAQARTENLRQLAEIEKDLGNPDRARQHLKNAMNELEQFDSETLDEDSIELIEDYGSLCQDSGKYEEARRSFERLNKLHNKRGNQIQQAESLANLGQIEEGRGQVERAREYFDRALELIEDHDQPRIEHYIRRQRGKLLEDQRKFDQAREMFEDCLDLVSDFEDDSMAAMTYGDLGRLAQKLGNHQEAESHLKKSIEINESNNNRHGKSITLNKLGKLYASIGELDQAENHYQEALELSRTQDKKQIQSICLERLGNIYRDQARFDEAEDHYQQALELNKSQNSDQGQSVVLNKLGTLSLHLGSLEKARDYYQRALELVDMINYDHGKAINRSRLGTLCLLQGRFEEARDHHRQASEINERIGNGERALHNHYQLALIDEWNQQYQQSLEITQDLQADLNHEESPDLAFKLRLLQARLACHTEEPREYQRRIDQASEADPGSRNLEELNLEMLSREEILNLDLRDLLWTVTLLIGDQAFGSITEREQRIENLRQSLESLVEQKLFGKEKQIFEHYVDQYLVQEAAT